MSAWRVRLLVHPITVAALLLLALNDHVFKQRWPGVITGKLSDVAGVWLVGALLIAALGSVRWGAALTALGFAALKTSLWVATMAAPLLGGVTRRDHTDLLALLALWPLTRVALACGAQRLRRNDDAWSTIGAVFVAMSAMLVTSATSCDTGPEVSEVALSNDGTPVARYEAWGSSAQLQSGWYALGEAEFSLASAPVPRRAMSQEVCVVDGCYRVVPDLGVYLDDTLLFQYSPDEAKEIGDRTECFQEPAFGSIVVVERVDGVELWVSAGMAGVLHRDVDGDWMGVAVGAARPVGSEPERVASRVILWIVPLLLAIGTGIAIPLMNRRLSGQRRVVITAAAVSVNIAWSAVSYAWLAAIDLDGPPLLWMAFNVIWWAMPLGLLQLCWIIPLTAWVRASRVPPPGFEAH